MALQISLRTTAILAIFSSSGSCTACVSPRVFMLRGEQSAEICAAKEGEDGVEGRLPGMSPLVVPSAGEDAVAAASDARLALHLRI